MTAITLAELSVADFPASVSGSALRTDQLGKRRVLVIVRGTAANADQTLNIATYVPGAADIEGEFFNTVGDGFTSATALTWSTTTVTFASGKGASGGVVEVGLIVTLT